MYHIQRHPGWLLALKQAIKIEDYHDFPFNNYSFISRISHSSNPVVDSLTTSHTETILSEEDYVQIVEYVRLAAMNIFVEYAVDEVERDLTTSSENAPDEYLSAQSLFKTRKLH